MTRYILAGLVAAILIGSVASAPVPLRAERPVSANGSGQQPFDGTLSVLTYNVKGLPWPIASGRPDALNEIAARLARLRSAGRAPHVIVLQEAFTDDARLIAARAGYRYIVDGPGADTPADARASAVDPAFAAAARWWNGETEGKLYSGGLQIASDYPIVATRVSAFPAAACAGYDCLANKGAVLASIAVPNVAQPVDVLAAHLNSRTASGVDAARADIAYAAQTAALADFVARAHDPRRMLIAAGDFNMGKAAGRRARLVDSVRRWSATPVSEALNRARRMNLLTGRDARWELRRAKDFQFFASGADSELSLQSVGTPFGRDATGTMLSDHVGWVARFRITPRDRTISAARANA